LQCLFLQARRSTDDGTPGARHEHSRKSIRESNRDTFSRNAADSKLEIIVPVSETNGVESNEDTDYASELERDDEGDTDALEDDSATQCYTDRTAHTTDEYREDDEEEFTGFGHSSRQSFVPDMGVDQNVDTAMGLYEVC